MVCQTSNRIINTMYITQSARTIARHYTAPFHSVLLYSATRHMPKPTNLHLYENSEQGTQYYNVIFLATFMFGCHCLVLLR